MTKEFFLLWIYPFLFYVFGIIMGKFFWEDEERYKQLKQREKLRGRNDTIPR